MRGFIFSAQPSLLGHRDVIGFGSPAFRVEEIPRSEADAIIKAGHYSASVVVVSSVHLGVFIGDALVGALQFGPAMNPASGGGVVEDCKRDEWLELNRMWLGDEAPRNSESRALSYAFKYLRRSRPALTWIQSFADERAGGCLGVVYQAANAVYLGEHLTEFAEFEGRAYHRMAWTASDRWLEKGRYTKWLEVKRAVEAGTVKPVAYRQFRYFFPLRRSVLRRLKMDPMPYPKPAGARLVAA